MGNMRNRPVLSSSENQFTYGTKKEWKEYSDMQEGKEGISHSESRLCPE